MARRRRNRTEESFQMAPMIDMVFLLLVFFMTVSTLAKDARPELELAYSRTARVPEAAPPKHIITAKREGEAFGYFYGNQKMELEQLQQVMLSKPPTDAVQVVLRGEPDLPWEVLEGLVSICREAGVADVVLATFED